MQWIKLADIVEAAAPPTSCPHCQSSNLVGFGRREQMVKDTWASARAGASYEKGYS